MWAKFSSKVFKVDQGPRGSGGLRVCKDMPWT